MPKYLVPLISLWAKNELTVNDSISLAREIQTYNLSSNEIMTSFDVKSLYTNIPLIYTI